jgi:hypothetical protein
MAMVNKNSIINNNNNNNISAINKNKINYNNYSPGSSVFIILAMLAIGKNLSCSLAASLSPPVISQVIIIYHSE